jgi:energy-coupling factor transporter ATP-binding protein EcfA2
MNYNLRLFVMEDEETSKKTKTGFYDCILPAIQSGIRSGQNVFILWSKMEPVIEENKIKIIDTYKSQYKAFHLTESQFKEIEGDQNYYLNSFNYFILDNWLAGGREIGVASKVAEKLISIKISSDALILVTKRGFPSQFFSDKRFHGVSCLSKEDLPNVFRLELQSLIELSQYKARFDKVCIYNNSSFDFVNELSSNNIKSVYAPCDTTDLVFVKAYVECWDEIPKEAIDRLITVSSQTPKPICILSDTIDNRCDKQSIAKEGIVFINPTKDNFLMYINRLSNCPTIIGGKETAGLLKHVLNITLDKRTSRGQKETNKGILITGASGVGKNHVAELINALSTHYSGLYNEPIKCPITKGFKEDSFAENVLGIGKFYTGAGAAPGSITKANNKSFIILEAGFLGDGPQSILLSLIEDGIYEQTSYPGQSFGIENVKFILTTNMPNEILHALKARCEHVQIKPLSGEDVVTLSLYFACRNNKVLSAEARLLMTNCRCPENARGVKTCIDSAKTSHWTISKEILEKAIALCTHRTEGGLLERVSPEQQGKAETNSLQTDWVYLWQARLRMHKDKFTSNDIIKAYPSSDGESLIPYPGTGYAGYGVLMHLAVAFGSWPRLGKLLKNNEEPRGKITKGQNDLLRELNKDTNRYKLSFLYKNKGFKQVGSNPDSFNVLYDCDVDFILIDTEKRDIFIPQGNSLNTPIQQSEFIPISHSIDEDNKKLIFATAKTKSSRSASSSKSAKNDE